MTETEVAGWQLEELKCQECGATRREVAPVTGQRNEDGGGDVAAVFARAPEGAPCKCGLPVRAENRVVKEGRVEHADCVKAHRDALLLGNVELRVLQGQVASLSGVVVDKAYKPLCFGEAMPKVCTMIPCPVLSACMEERDRLLRIGLSPTPVKAHCDDCHRDVLYPDAHAAYHRGVASQEEDERRKREAEGASA